MNFDDCCEIVLRAEGGYVFNEHDKGGETKYGISKRAFPSVDIAALTVEDAKSIYKTAYWTALQCDQLPAEVRLSVFDAGVNSGVRQAAKWLQRAAGATEDGIIGAKTIAAARAIDPALIVIRVNAYRLRFLVDLPTWKDFGAGWLRRVTGVMMEVNHG